MKVCIIGWYGTETLGDRAILAGIFELLHKTGSLEQVKLGSLFPFFSERTIAEDKDFYEQVQGINSFSLTIFNSKKIAELDQAITGSDLLVMGGGPLMHINDIFMVEYAFKKAKKLNKPSMIFGCGVGPLFKGRHKKAVRNIVRSAKATVLRDGKSREYFQGLFKVSEKELDEIKVLPDPSIAALLSFLNTNPISEAEPYQAINLRAFPGEYSREVRDHVNKALTDFIQKQIGNPELPVRLIPMHYFHVGGDDREFMNKIKFDLETEDLQIQNEPLNLYDTFMAFYAAKQCVGMRFHSVVFQTLLNGRNAILDYTEPGKGKISGFLHELNLVEVYRNRYVNLQEATPPDKLDLSSRVGVDREQLKRTMDGYVEIIQGIL